MVFGILTLPLNLLIIEVILSNLSSNLSCVPNETTFLSLSYPSHIFIYGVDDD